jgi:opacity protein-like surface antigen
MSPGTAIRPPLSFGERGERKGTLKKLCVLALTIVLSSITASASLSLGIQALYFSPSDSDFKSIYGGGVMYGGELSFTISNSFSVWVDGDYFAKTGSLTFSKDETKLTLVPLGLGLRYQLLPGKISPYIDAGVQYVLYQEKNAIGNVNSGGLGFVGKVGVLLFISNGFGFNILVDYSYCKMKPADFEFNVGGLGIGGGLVFSF